VQYSGPRAWLIRRVGRGSTPGAVTSAAMSRSFRRREWLAVVSSSKASSLLILCSAIRMPTAVPICRLVAAAICRFLARSCSLASVNSRIRCSSACTRTRVSSSVGTNGLTR